MVASIPQHIFMPNSDVLQSKRPMNFLFKRQVRHFGATSMPEKSACTRPLSPAVPRVERL